MSLINQMLQDLDKRRASVHERDVLPVHVRVLPEPQKERMPWWIAAASGGVIVAAAVGWQLARHPSAARVEAPLQQETVRFPELPASLTAVPRVEPAPAAAPAAPPAQVQAPQPIPSAAVINRDAPPPAKSSEVIAPRPAPVNAPAPEPRREAAPVPEPPRAPAARARERAEPRSEIPVTPAEGVIDKRAQQLTPQQLAENEYRDGANLLNQGRVEPAHQKFRNALNHNPAHAGARQALIGLLLETKRPGEAEQLLHEGLQVNVNQPALAMTLARMQVDRGDTSGAIDTLQKTAPAAASRADYIAFLAALLQRQSRHVEAVDHYQMAVQIAPRSGVWLMGLGISLQALNRTADARDAYRRALSANTLNAELQAFVSERLRQLQ